MEVEPMMNRLFWLPCLLALACARDPAFTDETGDAAAETDAGDAGHPPHEMDLGPETSPPADAAPEPPDEPDARTEDDPSADAGVPPLSPTFAALFDGVFEPASCASPYCHPGAHPDGFDARAFGQWLLTAEAEHAPCNEAPRRLVVPGDPAASLLYLKVAPGLAVCGAKMPNLDAEGIGLPPSQAERVRAWIADGARL
jgi:hypothetical protein